MKDQGTDNVRSLQRVATFQRPIPVRWCGPAITVVLAVAFAFSWTAAATAQQERADKPIISVDSPAHDFGATWIGPTLDHTFKITNKGSKTLSIFKIRPSCGCIVAGKYPVTLEPGQTGDFPFSINSHKIRGRYQKTIKIVSNDPVNSVLELKLHGECKRYVDVLPTAANFGKIYGDEKHERVLKVINNTKEPLKLKLDVPSESNFQFELVETKPGSEYEVHVTASVADAKPGMLRTIATLNTNKDAQKEIKLYAMAAIPRRLDVDPLGIRIREAEAKANKASAKTIHFTNYGDKAVKLLEATIDDSDVKVTVNEQTAGKRYDVRLDLPAGWQPPPTGRTLTLKTDDKDTPAIKVPISGEGRGKRTADRTPPKRVSPADLVGKPAPKFELTTTAGKKLSNQTLTDTVTVLDFFSPRCGHCVKQIPRVEQIRKTYADKGVRFVAVGQGTDVDALQAKIDTAGFQGELAVDGNKGTSSLFNVRGVPAMVILGKTGKVEAVNIGNIKDLETRMTGQLDALLAGKPLPKYESRTAQKKPRKRPAMEMVGKPAPQFSINTLKGKPVSTTEFAKHPATVLNFISPNCGYCKRQVPNVEKIRAEYEAKGIQFVNMSMKMGQGLNRETKQPWTSEEIVEVYNKAGSHLDIAIDEGNAVGQGFKATSFPTMVVVGRDGKVEHVNIGAKPDIDTILKGQLDELIKKNP